MIKNRNTTFVVGENYISQFGQGRLVDNNFDNDDEALGVCSKSGKVIFFDEILQIFFCQSVFYKNHFLAELKMSLRIAKNNFKLSPNSYYADQVRICEDKLNSFISAI